MEVGNFAVQEAFAVGSPNRRFCLENASLRVLKLWDTEIADAHTLIIVLHAAGLIRHSDLQIFDVCSVFLKQTTPIIYSIPFPTTPRRNCVGRKQVSFQPSFFSRTSRFPWDSGGVLERRIPRKNGEGTPRNLGNMLQGNIRQP